MAPIVLYLIVQYGESGGLTLCQYSIVLGLLDGVPFDQSRRVGDSDSLTIQDAGGAFADLIVEDSQQAL